MRDTKACRACLNTVDKLVKIPDSWYRMFETLTGVQASKSDGYPNYFCVECKSHIHKAITFRKKSRRAYYILKEIMMVRKEVNLPDILTVDRSKVSLASSLGIHQPKRSTLHALCTSEEGVLELTKENMTVINATSVIIDIKGEVPDFPEVPEVTPLNDDHTADQEGCIPDDNFEENVPDLDAEQKEAEPEIDLNDVFKGLKEPESEDELEVEKEKLKKEKKKKKEENKAKKESGYTYAVKARALLNYDVKELTEDEQKEVFKKRISHPIFTGSLYTCGICVKVMPTVDALMAHFSVHTSKTAGQFLCKICKDKFIEADEYDMHMKETHMYLYTCKICQEDVYSIRDMVKHKREKHITKWTPKEPIPAAISRFKAVDYEAELSDKFLLIPLSEDDKVAAFKKSVGVGKFVCDICGLGLPTNTQRQIHWQMHLRKPRVPEMSSRRQCTVCGVWCNKQEGLVKHMEAFHDYSYHCKLCSYEGSNRYLAVDHLTRKHREINACHICGATSSTAIGLDYHMQAHHQAVLKRHLCALCGNGFAAEFSLYAHQFRDHTFFKIPEPPAEGAENACTHCNVQFASTKAYHNHLVKAEHDEAKELPWKCLPCRKLFDSEAEARAHSAENCKHNKTPVVFPAPCQVCGEMMASIQRFYHHCKKEHPEVQFKAEKKLCDVCGMTYLATRAKKHKCLLGAPKYKCSVCEIVFHRPYSVVLHVLKEHMKEPFSCSICNKTFKRRFDCKDHILKIHAPVRPFLCPICSREYSHIDYLKKHGKDMHDVQIELDMKTPKKKDLLFLYPNMKVDLSLIDKNIIDEVTIKVADYTDQIFERITDYTDYVITSEDIRKKVDQDGQDYKKFIIRNQNLKKEEPQSKKTVKKTKKQMYRDFVFGEDTEEQSARTHQTFHQEFDSDEEQDTEENHQNFKHVEEQDTEENNQNIKQIEKSTHNDDGERSHQKLKEDLREFIITDNDMIIRDSGRAHGSKEYIIKQVPRKAGQSSGSRKRPKQDFGGLIFMSDDVGRVQSALPRKKKKFDHFKQEF